MLPRNTERSKLARDGTTMNIWLNTNKSGICRLFQLFYAFLNSFIRNGRLELGQL